MARQVQVSDTRPVRQGECEGGGEADILTFIKDRSERHEGEELVDLPQDVGLAGQRRILVPDLNHVFPVAHADADAHHLVAWKDARGDGEYARARTQLGCGHVGGGLT